MVEISPDVATALGVNPRHFPVAVFLGTLGAWATDLWLAVQEIKAVKKAAPTGRKNETEYQMLRKLQILARLQLEAEIGVQPRLLFTLPSICDGPQLSIGSD